MLFFLMLFAMTRMSAADKAVVTAGMESSLKTKAAKVEAGRDRFQQKEKEAAAIMNLRDSVEHGKLANQAKIAVTDQTVKITLNPSDFFATGSAQITSSTQSALESLVAPLRAFPNDIIIEGHTDNIPMHGGGYSSNWELSVARAVSVIDFFTSKGLAPRELIAGGYGEYHPAFPNDDDANRARNRRIEITILRQPGGSQ